MIFELSWSWYEDYRPILFEADHEDSDQWNTDCIEALRAAGPAYLDAMEKDGMWAGVPDWMDAAVEYLEKAGYRRVRPTVWNFFGGFILRKDSDTATKEGESWRGIVGKENFERAVAWNNRLQKKQEAWVKKRLKEQEKKDEPKPKKRRSNKSKRT